MSLRCPACGSKDLWQPRRHKTRFDLLVEAFGYQRYDCRGCWRRPILRVEKKKKSRGAPAPALPEPEPETYSPEVYIEEPVNLPASLDLPVPTVIGPTMLIRGEFHTGEGIRVYGRLEGSLHATGYRVVVEQAGSVAATVRAGDVVVRGRLEGDTVASGSITVCRDGRLIGEARTARLIVEDGAFVKGKNETGAELKPPTESGPQRPRVAREAAAVESRTSRRR